MRLVKCTRCKREFGLQKNIEEKYNIDGLCGKCRSRKKYLENPDKYRKIKNCPLCGKLILKQSKYCNSCSQLRDRNHQWTEDRQDILVYTTAEWREWRNGILERDDSICQLCGETEGRLHAHHILPKRDYPELLYAINNGVILCQDCHAEVHFKEYDYADYFLELVS